MRAVSGPRNVPEILPEHNESRGNGHDAHPALGVRRSRNPPRRSASSHSQPLHVGGDQRPSTVFQLESFPLASFNNSVPCLNTRLRINSPLQTQRSSRPTPAIWRTSA